MAFRLVVLTHILRVLLFATLAVINPTIANADDFIEKLNLGNLSDEAKEQLISWHQGNARLSCRLGCAFSWGLNRSEQKQQLNNANWIALAVTTLGVGFQSDQSYFYLGRAAEGIGDYANAITYYNLALNPRTRGHQCDRHSDCDGLDFPTDAMNRINIVRKQIDNQQLAQAQRDKDRREKEAATAAAVAAKLEEASELKRKEERTVEFNSILQNAEGGTCSIQHQVAKMYFAGDGTAVDEKVGLNWLSKSAQKGCAEAQYELSERYRAGNGLAKDEQKADDFLLKSSRQGHPEAQVKIKEMQFIKQERASQIAAAEREKLAKKRVAEQRLIKENEELESKRKLDNINKLKSL